MVIEKKFRCDFGGEIVEDERLLRNEVDCLASGQPPRIYDYVCEKHYEELVKLLDERFPKNKYILKVG